MSDVTNSKPVSTPSRTALQDSTSESIDSKGGSLQYVKQIVEDKSQLILTILAMILASFAIGQNFSESSARAREREDMKQIIRSEVDRGIAEAKAAMQEQAAQAQATAEAGRQHARVALDKVEDFRTKLAEKGIKIAPLDGH